MKVEVHNRCSDFNSYRAARVKSLFNAETGANFDLEAELPIDNGGWSLGLIVGASGSGKTSLGRQIWGGGRFYEPSIGRPPLYRPDLPQLGAPPEGFTVRRSDRALADWLSSEIKKAV